MSFFPHASLVFGLILALLTAAAFNWSWVAQHTITSQMERLDLRRPMWSLKMLFSHRRWLFAFLIGIAGWAFYILALRLAPLSLVQSVSAGGIGLIAIFAQRATGERLPRREWIGVGFAVVGLVFLSGSLADASTHAHHGSWGSVTACFVIAGLGLVLFLGPLSQFLAPGAGWGISAGLMDATADIGTKAVWQGGLFLAFILPVWACHGIAFTTLQMGFQRGRALATAGLSSFMTNALPIVAGITVFREHVPGGGLGALRIIAFACVVVGAAAVARREREVDELEEPALATANPG